MAEMPNLSCRMNEVTAAVMRPLIKNLPPRRGLQPPLRFCGEGAARGGRRSSSCPPRMNEWARSALTLNFT